jgi:hypothetical protein
MAFVRAEKEEESWPQEDDDSEDLEDSDEEFNPLRRSEQHSDEVQFAFDEILSRARNSDLSLSTSGARKEFLLRYGEVLSRKTRANGQTLLHIIAGTIGHKSLTRCVLRNDKKLLQERNDNGQTPLFIAIGKKNFDFISVVIKEIKDLDTLLSMDHERYTNCIHKAVNSNLEPEFSLKLIEKASEATLCAKDEDGLTPLHLAVDYERSSDAQLIIVQELIAHCEPALDQLTTNPKDLSVYEYHQYTRSRSLNSFTSTRSKESSYNKPRGGIHDQIDDPTSKRDDGKDNLSFLETNDKRENRPPRRKTEPNEDIQTKASQEKEQNAEKIQTILKLSYLRSTFRTGTERDQGKAARFLYGTNTASTAAQCRIS